MTDQPAVTVISEFENGVESPMVKLWETWDIHNLLQGLKQVCKSSNSCKNEQFEDKTLFMEDIRLFEGRNKSLNVEMLERYYHFLERSHWQQPEAMNKKEIFLF